MKPTRFLPPDPPADAARAAPASNPPLRGRIVVEVTGTRRLNLESAPSPADQAADPPAAVPGAALPGQTVLPTADGRRVPTCGWLVVLDGPGRGASFDLVAGMNAIGRGPGVGIALNPGDASLTPGVHLFLAYDAQTRLFHAAHAGQANLVRLNETPLLAPALLRQGDRLRIGASLLAFVPFCGPDFDWADATVPPQGPAG